jgi:subtilisin family serine protease
MKRTSGSVGLKIGLIDGPVNLDHPDLINSHIQTIVGDGKCTRPASCSCNHGTFVAGILSARRGSSAPAIAPGCTLLIRSIFPEGSSDKEDTPNTSSEELARAIFETVQAGAHVINLSAGLAPTPLDRHTRLNEALNYAAQKSVLLVAAAGNHRTIGSSAITSHPWVIPVVSCDTVGRPAISSNLGASIARRGVSAPGEGITSLGANHGSQVLSGTSVAAPFVTGAIALLWSEFPDARANAINLAISRGKRYRDGIVPHGIVPPLVDAWSAYQILRSGLPIWSNV